MLCKASFFTIFPNRQKAVLKDFKQIKLKAN